MTPATILREAALDGVILSLSSEGKVKAAGHRGRVDKWLPTIREQKISLIALLSDMTQENIDVNKITSTSPDLADPVSVLPCAEIIDFPEIEEDRRYCTQCLNLGGRTCVVARLGGPVSARRGYEPLRDVLHRCAGYAPNTHDADQRTGHDRWPGLVENEEAKQ